MGVAAFGGLLLIVAILPATKVENPNQATVEENPVVLQLPADLPNFPIYPGVTIRSVNDTDGENSRDVSVSLIAQASKEEVNDWYREALSNSGWNIKSDKNVGGYQIIQGENNNLYTSMQAAGGNGELVISQHLKVRK